MNESKLTTTDFGSAVREEEKHTVLGRIVRFHQWRNTVGQRRPSLFSGITIIAFIVALICVVQLPLLGVYSLGQGYSVQSSASFLVMMVGYVLSAFLLNIKLPKNGRFSLPNILFFSTIALLWGYLAVEGRAMSSYEKVDDLYEEGRYEEAIAVADRANSSKLFIFTLNEDASTVAFEIARCYTQLGDFDGALAYLDMVVERDYDYYAESSSEHAAEMREALARIESTRGRGLDGIPHLKSLYEIAFKYRYPLYCDSCATETVQEIVDAGFIMLKGELSDDERADVYHQMFMANDHLELDEERRALWASFETALPDTAKRWQESSSLSEYAR